MYTPRLTLNSYFALDKGKGAYCQAWWPGTHMVENQTRILYSDVHMYTMVHMHVHSWGNAVVISAVCNLLKAEVIQSSRTNRAS